jgi:TRAP-type C4-dicarboxylate transport system substrate-binding protein
VVDAKFYEVTCQIALTSHLVDLNYIAFSEGGVGRAVTPDQQAIVQQAADDAAGAAASAAEEGKRARPPSWRRTG